MFRKRAEIWEYVPKKPESKLPVIGGAVVLLLIVIASLGGCDADAKEDQPANHIPAEAQDAV